MNGEARMRAPLYGPSAAELRRQLPDLGDGLRAQCIELHNAPSPERCERLALNLDGARRAVLQLAETMRHEQRGAPSNGET
ncbi:hypothetical protein [Pseudoxanthomonas wuyuanensis]|uniref:hypothetical protein n=1 Tax=Pseudoxanthomonas wuyuanensis TaxID=1073196 RepID=UPI001389DB01|nr:hypothetical protein [Pseudoxanthomonas wuyuanensis]